LIEGLSDGMTLSSKAEKLLMERMFRAFVHRPALGIQWAEEVLDSDAEEARTYLEELEREGFIEPHPDPQMTAPGPWWAATERSWRASERLLRAKGMRREPLVNQHSYELKDLILALCYEHHGSNRKGIGFLGMTTPVPLDPFFVLLDWPRSTIERACNDLVEAELVTRSSQRIGTVDAEYLDLTRKGLKYYEKSVCPKFRLSETDSLLDPPGSLSLFFAWQSEYKPSRNILSEAVPKVIEDIKSGNQLLRELRFMEATEPGEGALRIDVALQEKIRQADYFVGDLTPVYAYDGRLRVNENVLVEAGFALASKPPGQILLLSMAGVVVPGTGSNPQLAFDIGHIRRIEFRDKKDARRKLLIELTSMLRRDGWLL
jgi:hypothetical protein